MRARRQKHEAGVLDLDASLGIHNRHLSYEGDLYISQKFA